MKPLEGITVLEFSTMITASLAAMMLGEQGARVIKVEPTDMGDPMRYIGTSKGGISSLFANCNRGKESIRVNIKDEAGQALIRELVSGVDVLVHNFRPGVMDKLNLGSEQLRAENPKLIYMAISGFGTAGPLSSAPAYDPVIQAHSGMTSAQGRDEQQFIKNLMCDKLTAYTACQALTTALYVRERTGEGQHIDLSMLDAGMAFLFPDAYQNHTLLDDDVEVQPLLSDLLYELTLTSDGGLTLSAATDAQRAGVLKALNMESLMADERFNSLEKLLMNFEEYRAILSDAFMQMTTDEALEKLQANEVPCAKCHTLDEALAQEQLAANGSVEVQDHPLMGKVRVFKTPARFGGEVLAAGGPVPAHGENTNSVLESFAVESARIDELKSTGVIV
ncbi:MAG: CoA transferase [Pseudomonadales bacterium]|nr:CoA transferase [Pseudomonadales bacterium]MBO6563495.1 CoA transferase [Pseudomonadales bacterium]MBO6597787.1 CoA transferase [Pseudomonadales bacterium]MBO6655927.1 CoA transferase [Pseudomonadales bacterium]MBO6704102.1 CoA transferase [Pseudomonadales bacterium]